MYTRSFYDSEHTIPEGYDGEALRENVSESYTIQPTSTPQKISPPSPDYEAEEIPESAFSFGGIFDSIWEALPFKRFFGNMSFLGQGRLDIEDIILIGIALVLFFSECGDRTLALMLIGLLFISKE